MTVRALLICNILFVLTACGCGGNGPAYTGPTRYAISGKVTFNGEPVTTGTIALIPDEEGLNPAGGEIKDGAYSVVSVKGPNKGNYRVQVFWYRPTGNKIADEDTGQEIDEVAQVIPPQFNGATEVTTTISGADSALNFDIAE